MATEKLLCWTAEILVIKPVIEHKKGSTNLIGNSLLRLRMEEHYKYNTLLENKEPIHLKEKAEINMVQTHTKTAEQENITPKPPELQIKVWDIFRVLKRGS